MEKIIKTVSFSFLAFIIFIFPFFFLPFTQDFFSTAKMYLLAFSALILTILSLISFLINKKLSWQKLPFDSLLILFLLTIGLSVIFSSPNKVQALLNPNFGPVLIGSLVILYFYLSRQLIAANFNRLQQISIMSAVIISIITIITFFQPLKNITLPSYLAFLANPSFTPLGSQVDLAIFIGFFLILGTINSLHHTKNETVGQLILNYSLFIINLFGLFFCLYSLFRLATGNQQITLSLTPFRLSWYAAVETLKNFRTALFGVGVDNFLAIFTRVKDIAYNQSSFWKMSGFPISRSTLLHVFTETGLFGFAAFLLIFFNMANRALKQSSSLSMKFVIGYLSFVILFFPPSPTVWFLFFLTIVFLTTEVSRPALTFNKIIADKVHALKSTFGARNRSIDQFDFSHLLPLCLGILSVGFFLVAIFGYLLARSYLAEAVFKKSLDGFSQNNLRVIYNNQRRAVILNPFIERFRIGYSQTNMLIANNIASKVNRSAADQTTTASPQSTSSDSTRSTNSPLSDQDRQTIAQAIQTAIAEAKAAVALNPQKAVNWENLAVIYHNILTIAQGADTWAISSYQRAIVADPQNPNYRLSLGGVYYSLNQWENAIRLFEQTVFLKSDYANAYYNLAWAYYQKGEYKKAVNAMESCLKFIDPANKADYDKAKSELEDFKQKLPQEEVVPTKTPSPTQPSQLRLPSPAPSLEPKISLPEEASPEAQ